MPFWSARTLFTIVGVACWSVAAQAQTVCSDPPEGRICHLQQRIIAGALVSVQTQQDLGLVTVGGGCSGTLVNRFWVLTADHCVTLTGRV